tara:strand:+ start:443 stop:649 length:207 start_codon:yes stop_codon:yes gene_type:complete
MTLDLNTITNGTILKVGTFNKFKVLGKNKYGFTGELLNNSDKVMSKEASVPFSNFSNPHYSKNISILN